MPTSDNLQIGFNARLFPTNWRPVVNEIRFGAEAGFAALQFPGMEGALTNEHLPLGLGSVNFAHFCHRLRTGAFAGPAILEIGGLPKSGGFGRDSDHALIDSLHRLQAANALVEG
jgi:sugar phosphate isomerase/epimerase